MPCHGSGRNELLLVAMSSGVFLEMLCFRLEVV